MNLERYERKYAELLVRLGVAVQKGEYLLLEADAENYELARYITEAAFERGARDVIVFLRDAGVDHIRSMQGSYEEISSVAPWQKEGLSHYLEQGAVSLLLKSPHPSYFAEATPEAGQALQTFANDLRNVIRQYSATKGLRWCIACAPNRDWADFLFPEQKGEAAYEALWKLLMDICRVDETSDPVENWLDFLDVYGKHAGFLNRHHFDRIHFYNGSGTDFVVGFHPRAFWAGGFDRANYTPTTILANIPTNEIDTSPDKYRMDGVVCSSLPLVYAGQKIDGMRLTFRGGRVVEAVAREGQEALDRLLAVDEGSRYLGEVAFVENDLPLARCGKVFYVTLLDENAACHMALGNGFTYCVPGLEGADAQACEEKHLNVSKQHVDFMFGTADLNADGYDQEGNKIPIFRAGKFVPEN